MKSQGFGSESYGAPQQSLFRTCRLTAYPLCWLYTFFVLVLDHLNLRLGILEIGMVWDGMSLRVELTQQQSCGCVLPKPSLKGNEGPPPRC